MNSSIGIGLAEKGLLPDPILRWGIRALAKERIRSLPPENGREGERHILSFLQTMSQGPIAIHTDKANEQHYELPPEFFTLILGPQRKYSCCHYEKGTETLTEAEECALRLSADHAQLEDGQEILELGCGWGSMTLWMARHFPNSRILAVSNSNSQRLSILKNAQEAGLENVEVLTCDMNVFKTDRQFDRIVSIEMFEHMRNWSALMTRISDWLKPEGRFFMHVFTHRTTPYFFEVEDESDWMSRFFFSGGMMPSLNLPHIVASPLEVEAEWIWSGMHYKRTADQWLANMDRHQDQLSDILSATYGPSSKTVWFNRWRLFFLACSEIFGYAGGDVWPIGHYRLKKRPPN